MTNVIDLVVSSPAKRASRRHLAGMTPKPSACTAGTARSLGPSGKQFRFSNWPTTSSITAYAAWCKLPAGVSARSLVRTIRRRLWHAIAGPAHFQGISMKTLEKRCLIGTIALLIYVGKTLAAQLEPACVANSPERRGEIGCSIVEDKPLPTTLKELLFWHIDRFDSGERARAEVGSASVALEAYGVWRLLTIESRIDESSQRVARHGSGTLGAAGSTQVFSFGDISLYPAGDDVACASSLRAGGVLHGRRRAVPRDADTRLQNA
jgi:hypothetical protein